jgi:formiminotetrahydrofolate cyclodeaminase
MMALGISLKSKKLEASKRPGLEKALEVLSGFKPEFHRLTREDATAFDRFMEAVSLPKEDPSRPGRMQEALAKAAEVPLETAAKASQAHRVVCLALPLIGSAVSSDMHCALHLLKAAGFCAAENVRINLAGMKDKSRAAELESRLVSFLKAWD